MSPYVCPDCNADLLELTCSRCGSRFESREGFPILLSKDPKWRSAHELVAAYETIYTEHSQVWVNQGRTEEFIRYFAALLGRYGAERLLEIGCGEGILLAAAPAKQKFGTDLSVQALKKAAARVTAQLGVALGESLPFASESFDVVTSVGVMEHFADDRAATREVLRVLKPGGHYVLLIHVHLTLWQSVMQKLSEYVFPRPRPIGFLQWVVGKFYKPVHQPIQNKYTIVGVQSLLEECGFVVTDVIHKRRNHDVPLIGPHVIIYACERPR
jgi:SAM-dependent methyltransferase